MTWWGWLLVIYAAAGIGYTLNAIVTRDQWLKSTRWSWSAAFGLLIGIMAIWPVLLVMDIRQWIALQKLRTAFARSQGIPRRKVSGRYVRQMTPPPDVAQREE